MIPYDFPLSDVSESNGKFRLPLLDADADKSMVDFHYVVNIERIEYHLSRGAGE